jgi:hypothetical protein
VALHELPLLSELRWERVPPLPRILEGRLPPPQYLNGVSVLLAEETLFRFRRAAVSVDVRHAAADPSTLPGWYHLRPVAVAQVVQTLRFGAETCVVLEQLIASFRPLLAPPPENIQPQSRFQTKGVVILVCILNHGS